MSCCGKSRFVKYVWLLLGLIILIAVIFSLTSCGKKEPTESPQVSDVSKDEEILYYTCGMHPSVRVSPEEYNKGKTNCPICNMNLVPVYKEKATKPKEEGVVGSVRLEEGQITRTEIQTVPVRRHHLFKEIRTVGKIAYDPQLAIAQDEYLSALDALDKISKGDIGEITRRADKLVESSERKLRLLGMNQEQIIELKETRKIQSNLILPEERVWVYADIYEFELGWIKEEQEALVTTAAFPGEEFKGTIKAINPTLDPRTRSVRIRLEIENPGLRLKPDMYVDVIIKSMYISPEGSHEVLAVPREAVLDTGTRRLVWVDLGNGEFQGRVVRVGPEASTEINGKIQRYLPILGGVDEGELVVTKGNFLIDSQSQLTGTAAAVYGGALEAEEEATPPAKHVH